MTWRNLCVIGRPHTGQNKRLGRGRLQEDRPCEQEDDECGCEEAQQQKGHGGRSDQPRQCRREEEEEGSGEPRRRESGRPCLRPVFAKIAQDEIDRESAPRPVQIPTIAYFKPPTLFHSDELFSVRRSGKKAVLSAAKFLLGVSSSLDGEPLRRCSGLWVDWDEESKTGLVLTTARLIRTKDAPVSVWSGGEEYATNAHVTVHLLNGTSAKGQLVYHQPHYDLALLNVQVNQPIKLPSFNEKDVEFA
ncbi:uncharacterized protein [Triticum aestivum]|uniref:uncharacterized protein n=1 Tax=Triticum aestivum TaxID=4565 RepID=UPI001D00893A|nr:uncharacterized protein LOC123114590 [Triticum aestivum]